MDVGWVWDEVEEDIPDLFDHVRRAVSTKMATLEDDFNSQCYLIQRRKLFHW